MPDSKPAVSRGTPTTRRRPLWNADDSSALLAVLLCLGTLGLSSCDKSEPAKPAAEADQPKPAAAAPANVSDSELDSHIAAALTPPPPAEPLTNDSRTAISEEAERILDLYPDKNAQELLNVPEVNSKLANSLKKLAADKALQDYINGSVDLAAQITGLEGGPGTYGLSLDLKVYDHQRTSRLLQSVLTEDPRHLVDFLAKELGEAAVDIGYGGMDKSPNGISLVRKNPPPAPAAPPPEEK